MYVSSSTTVPYLDVVIEGINTWWNRIYYNGMNYRMEYRTFLENKPNSPLGFVQNISYRWSY
ncbi:hypothetical protein OESDEN_09878 [Oesophagostomum dentatum]|uniref:Uncharacterized protein n=1 Tax=Oesophagostomum dentatum TaxID=61180 RepID=A0A0B1T2A3_OESDE|nr:hypothetical protein OESDEN_09878 [Oesophagostomum dentatum]